MTDIDAEVAEFAAQLNGLAAYDAALVERDVRALFDEIVLADTHSRATHAVAEVVHMHRGNPAYARSVVLEAVSRATVNVMIATPTWDINRMLSRLHRIALMCRAFGWEEPKRGGTQ